MRMIRVHPVRFLSRLLLGVAVSVTLLATGTPVRALAADGFTYTVSADSATVTGCDGTCPTTLIIPAILGGYSVASIGIGAFQINSLTSVTIPSSVTSIGTAAFLVNQLTSVTIPSSVTSIGSYAFVSNLLTSVTIGSSVTRIGTEAFSSNQLTSITIPNSVTIIDIYAFYDNQLTSVTIGSSVTSIGIGAFQSNSLTSVTIPDSVTSIGDDAFWGNQLTSVSIGSSVTTIGAGAFGENALTSVIIPNSVTTIGGSAFYNNALASVTIGDSVTSIGDSAFFNNNLTSVIIPNSVTSIDDSAFQENDLTSVTIGNSVTSIGSYAFNRNLLTNITIPSSVQSIGREAFSSNALTSVVFAGNAPASGTGVFASNTGLWWVLRYASATGWGSTWSGEQVVTIKQTFSEPFVARVDGSAAGATVIYAGPSTTVTLDTIGQTGAGVISFSESDPDCSISGRSLRILQVGNGSCIVTATIGESTTHYGASDTVTVTISKVAASLTFTQPSNVSYGVAPFNLVATTSNTDSATVTFTVAAASQSVCSVRGRIVTVKATGRCTITASRTATTNYLAATSVVQSFTVMKAATATTRPTISGTARVGNKLTASKGTWTGYPTPTFTYQWYACTAAVSSPRTSIPRTCTPISSATGSTFTVQSAQRGKYIAVLVTGTSAGTRSTSWLSKTITKVP